MRKGRISQVNQIYLITTVTYQRKALFSDFRCGRIITHELMHADGNQYTDTLAYVVMPDHLHWLISLSDKASLSMVVGAMKRHSARQVNKFLNRTGQPVWQRGFHDHALRSEESVIEAARYIIANPLRAGLAKRVGDYPLWDAVWL